MDLMIWLPCLFVLGLIAMGLMFAFVAAAIAFSDPAMLADAADLPPRHRPPFVKAHG